MVSRLKRLQSIFFHRTALRIALTYLLLSFIWITTSDQLLALLASSAVDLTRWQTYKGTGFIVVSAWLIYVMIQRAITQRERIEKDLHQRNRELALLNEASNVHNLPLTDAFNQLLQSICYSLSVMACSIFLIDEIANGLPASTCAHEDAAEAFTWLQQHGQNISNQAIGLAEPDVRMIAPETDDYLVTAIPLQTKDYVYGTLIAITAKEDHPQNSDKQLLLSIASAVAITIENTHLYNRLARHAADLEQRIAERTLSLAQANENLRTVDELKSKFIAEITRELRTPITNLVVYTDLIKHGTPERRMHYIQSLEQQVARLVRLFEDSLDLSRLEMLRMEAERPLHPLNLNQTVAGVIASFHPRTQESNVALHSYPADDLPEISGEQNQIAHAVGHLLTNAFSYTAVGEITVRTSYQPDQNRICLEAADTGYGIDTQDLPYVFDSFYRGRHAKTLNVPGNGLGLTIVKEIVELHKGQIEIESKRNEGTTVRLYLPVAPAYAKTGSSGIQGVTTE